MTLRDVRRHSIFAIGLGLAVSACGAGPVELLDTSLVGTWTLSGYTDGERVAVPSGHWVFLDDGVMALDIALTFPDENTVLIARTGYSTRTGGGGGGGGNILAMDIGGFITRWTMNFSASRLLLMQTSPDPADNTITLDRR